MSPNRHLITQLGERQCINIFNLGRVTNRFFQPKLTERDLSTKGMEAASTIIVI